MDNTKIKFYSEMEACTYANRFTTKMTLGELKQKVLNNEFPIIEHEAYSIDFGQNMKGKALDINGMKVRNAVTEDGRRVFIYPEESPIRFFIDEEPIKSPWTWLLHHMCTINELKEENRKLKEQLKQKGSQ